MATVCFDFDDSPISLWLFVNICCMSVCCIRSNHRAAAITVAKCFIFVPLIFSTSPLRNSLLNAIAVQVLQKQNTGRPIADGKIGKSQSNGRKLCVWMKCGKVQWTRTPNISSSTSAMATGGGHSILLIIYLRWNENMTSLRLRAPVQSEKIQPFYYVYLLFDCQQLPHVTSIQLCHTMLTLDSCRLGYVCVFFFFSPVDCTPSYGSP